MSIVSKVNRVMTHPLGGVVLADVVAFCRVSCWPTVITGIGTVSRPAR